MQHGFVDLDEYKKRINPKTKLVVICHASNIYGSIQDAKAICILVKENGSLSLVDAAQTIARMPVNVKDLGCDFLAICGRKHLCGPQGCSALFVKEDRINLLEPIFVGGGVAKMTEDFEYELFPGVGRFNAGILNTSGAIGLGEAVNFWMNIGIDKVWEHIRNISIRIFEKLENLDATIYSPKDMEKQAGIISFRLPQIHPDQLADTLEKEYKILIRSGSPGSPVFTELGVDKINRLAPHYYTGDEEFNRLFDAIEDILKK